MPVSVIKVDVDAAALIRKLRDDRFAREPLRVALVNIGRFGETDAKRRSQPRQSGNLINRITHQIDNQPLMLSVQIGVIGATGQMAYAKYIEYGTGLMHDHPSWPRRRHIVKPEHLAKWRPVRGNPEAMKRAARAITARGGIKPRRYLRGMLEDNSEQFVRIVSAHLRKLTL